MNVGHPSNLTRLVSLFGGMMDEKGIIHTAANMEEMQNQIWAVSISDDKTRQTIADAYKKYNLLLEPHGAVGWAGLMDYLKSIPEAEAENSLCISLETAHPAKFPEEIEKILHIDPVLPPSLEGIDHLKEHVTDLESSYEAFKEYLLTSKF